MYIPTIKPNSPIALPKISIISILTKSEEFAASDNAAPDPVGNNNIKNISLEYYNNIAILKDQ